MEKQPTTGVTIPALPFDLNEKLEVFTKDHFKRTGKRLSKPNAIINILEEGLK